MKTSKKEFENLISQSMSALGLDELSSKLIGVLYSEPEKLTLEELSERTNYSFSAVSAAMKFLSKAYIVEKSKTGGSKKLYFSVQRDMLRMTLDQVKKKNERMITPALQNLPGIIKRCKQSKEKGSKETLRILEQYYQQMQALDRILTHLAEYTKKVQGETDK